jgi:hypothetical protein
LCLGSAKPDGELTLAFAAAAHHQGWPVPEEDPHPSLPLSCLREPKRRVVTREPAALASLDAELREAIERSFSMRRKVTRKAAARRK